jgi:adhesin transport system outer membrane protein
MYFYRIRSLTLLAVVSLCHGTVQAQEGLAEEFKRSIQSAVNTHPLTLSAARGVEASGQDEMAAKWQRFPSPTFQRLVPQGSVSSTSINRLLVEQPLYAGGRIEAGIEAASNRRVASQSYYEQVTQDIAIKLVGAWFDWQRSRHRIEIVNEALDAHRRLKQQIDNRVQEGVSSSTDLALAIARLGQVMSDLAQAESTLAVARGQLRQLGGDQYDRLVAMDGALSIDIFPKPQPEWETLALSRDPLVARLMAERDAADADIRLKRSQILPTVSVVLEKNYTENLGYPSQRSWIQVSAQPGAGLSSMSSIGAAVGRKEASEQAIRNAELELRQNLTMEMASYTAGRDQSAVVGQISLSSKAVAESYARQFVAGRKSWLEVLNAVREAMQARLQVLDAKTMMGQSAWRLHLRAYGLGDGPVR